eukprot:CAMPEP_0197268146 /NCGR_PEP_ID=MMETSP1432-20130617/4001_1 /TAXON_ID=44447 /ORGANISM="Pseudo-nitzschia delicatissima, Strain UNC1205" /LENGTH=585 /DNA_ID=CAMNT_0042733169 /DNA_START=215 /DNA_END=1972 /DNA_ORIENTATION=+
MATSQDTLYAGKTDFVNEFDPQTKPFATIKSPRVVEFYSPMCPFCVSFSPHYMKLAQNTKKIYPEILFYGVSCDKYEKVCDEYGIEGYPTLRFFKADDGPTTKGIEKEFEVEDAYDESTPAKIASLVYVTDPLQNYKSDYPGTTTEQHNQLKTVMEQHYQIRKGIKYRFNQKNIEQGTSVVTYDDWTKGMKQNTPGTPEFLDRQKAFQKRVQMIKSKNIKRDATQGQQTGEKKMLPYSKDARQPKWYHKLNPEEELILDTTLSLVVSFETGLSMGITDVTSKSAMKKWLHLLSLSLPPEWNVHKLISELKAIDYDTVTRESFREIVGRYPIARKGWSPSCKNQALGSAGFTCGFWKLLHVITLGVAEQRGGQNLIDSGDLSSKAMVFSPSLAAETIRNYIDKFFTCKPCREHFLETFDECENNRRCKRLTRDETTENPSDWKELAIYFWEFHNDVSVRLVGERIRNTFYKGVRNAPTAKDEVAALFPAINNCRVCYVEGEWNKAEVFGFLERTYWPDSEKDPLTDKLLKFEGESKSGVGSLLLAMALVVGLVVVLVERVTGRQSYLIHQSLVTARQLVSTKSRTV